MSLLLPCLELSRPRAAREKGDSELGALGSFGGADPLFSLLFLSLALTPCPHQSRKNLFFLPAVLTATPCQTNEATASRQASSEGRQLRLPRLPPRLRQTCCRAGRFSWSDFGLLCIGTERTDGTVWTAWLFCQTDSAAMVLKQVAKAHAPFLRDDTH